jgi:hypothetical protein
MEPAEPEPEAPTRKWCDVQECVRVVDNAYGGECYVASRDISGGARVRRAVAEALLLELPAFRLGRRKR